MISYKKYFLLFLIIFIHITFLDLFFVTLNGPVFLFDENLRIETILVHLLIAVTSIIICIVVTKIRLSYKTGKLKLRDNVLILCSVSLAISIYFVLF